MSRLWMLLSIVILLHFVSWIVSNSVVFVSLPNFTTTVTYRNEITSWYGERTGSGGSYPPETDNQEIDRTVMEEQHRMGRMEHVWVIGLQRSRYWS